MAADDLSREEQATLELVIELLSTRDLDPLIARLADGTVSSQGARDVLRTLCDFDPEVLVQLTHNALVTTDLENPAHTHQPERVVAREHSLPD